MTVITSSEKETEDFAFRFASTLSPGTVIAFTGEVGAGKTVFVRGIAKALGISSHITSPTFTIVNEYPADIPLFHFDLYRLSGIDDLIDIGWDDYLAAGGICCVEWSEICAELFREDDRTIYISINKISDNQRKISIN